jgi:hypothetical protein
VLGVAEQADEDVLRGQVGVEDHGDTETGERKTVGDLLHERTSGAESGRCDVGSAVVVDDDTDDEVCADGDTTAEGERPDVLLGVPHLRGDGEVGGHTSEGEDERGDGRHGLREGRVADELPVGGEVASLRSSGRAILNTSSDGDGEDGSENAEHANPREPADLAQCADAGNDECDEESDGDEDGRAGAVSGDGVKSNGNTKHSRASDEDPEETESDGEDVAADGTKEEHAHVGNTVNFRVLQLELTNNVRRPGGDGADRKQENDTRNHAENGEGFRDRKHTETDFCLHHEDRCSEPSDTEVVGTAFFIDIAEDCILDLAIATRGNADELFVKVLLVLCLDSHVDDGDVDEERRRRRRRRKRGGEMRWLWA